MFYVTIGDIQGNDEIIYYPSDNDFIIFDTNLKQIVGDTGEFSFSVPCTNQFYNKIEEYRIITIYKDNNEYWRGFVKEINTDIEKNLEVYCVGDLGWLAYECMEPMQRETTKVQIFNDILNYYNNQTGIKGTVKEFQIGLIEGGSETFTFESTYEMSLLDCLRVVADNKYLRIRRQNNKRYIDIVSLDNYGKQSKQSIQFGENLIDFAQELNTDNMLNVLYPYGAEIEGQDIYEGLQSRIVGTAILNADSIAKYGRIAKNIIFEDAGDIEAVNQEAKDYLKKYSKPTITIKVSAIDLELLSDIPTENIDIGDRVEIIAENFGFMGNDYIPVVEMNLNLQDIGKNVFTLASNVNENKSFTQLQGEITAEIKKIPSRSEVLKAAQRNAQQMLEGTSGGYLTYKFNQDGQIEQLWITDSPDKDKATKKWIWSMGGLGYQYIDTDINSETYGQWISNTAMTIDGSIVADFITSGKLTLAGNGSDATLAIYDGNGLIGKWDSDGLYAKKGTFEGELKAATGSFAGRLDAASGTFAGELDAGCIKTGTITGRAMVSPNGKSYIHLDTDQCKVSFGNGKFKVDVDGRCYTNIFEIERYMKMDSANFSVNAGGTMAGTNWAQVYKGLNNTTSDQRVKKDIKEISVYESKQLIDAFIPKKFRFDESYKAYKAYGENIQYGAIAQELKSNLMEKGIDVENIEIVHKDDDLYRIEYTQFIPHLINVVKEQQKQIDELIKKMKGEKDG